MTPTTIVAVILAVGVLIYVVAGAVFSYLHPDVISLERGRLWSDLMAVLIGGLVAFISRKT